MKVKKKEFMRTSTLIDPVNTDVFLIPIAQLFQTNIEEKCQESSVSIPKKFGSGEISFVRFACGVNLALFDITLEKDLHLEVRTQVPAPILFNFCVEGEVTHQFEDGQFQHRLRPLQGAISASTMKKIQVFKFTSKQHTVITLITMDREQYMDKVDCNLDNVPVTMQNLIRDVKATQPFFYQSNYSISIAECIKEMADTSYEGLIRATFLEAQALQVLHLQIKQYRDDLLAGSKRIIVREQDTEKIDEARKILKASMQNAPTIPELAKKVGINQQKLKKGFKQLFNQTIGEYLRNIRMERAKILLLEGSLSVMSIAEEVGYTNSGHFARRFKQKYGVLPKDYLKYIRSSISNETLREQATGPR